jgi:hypothetical protein
MSESGVLLYFLLQDEIYIQVLISYQFLIINDNNYTTVKNNNKIFNICTLFSKIEKSDLESSKHSKILYPTRFQYEKFNESEKSKFRDDLIYFLS